MTTRCSCGVLNELIEPEDRYLHAGCAQGIIPPLPAWEAEDGRRSERPGGDEPRACTRCEVVKAADKFYMAHGFRRGECRECSKARQRERDQAKRAAMRGVAA